ncbi:AMP-binding protein [Streptomyces sp. C10-9-1]|uniref:AMP-binding protein n=1 Tax=Streptomyces sp. C10-9-1 TaxID=1859285 RepID=UPI003F49EA7B
MTGTAYEQRTLYDWFAASVAEYGKLTALEVAGERLSYTELHGLVERVAGEILVASGGEAPERIGLLASRSLAAYAGYLAIQRLGSTAVPLNPAWPAARTAKVVSAGEAGLVLADGDLAPTRGGAALDELVGPILRLDGAGLRELRERRTPGNAAATDPMPAALPGARKAGPDDLAYILFTSGSTGAPKGVPTRHRNISPYIAHIIGRYRFGPGSRASQTFDLAFDASLYDLFGVWGSGATLVVPSRSEVVRPSRFVARERITHWCSVPSVIPLAEQLGELAPGSMPTLRWSVFGAEPLTLKLVAAWREAAPNSALENVYGPTELTVTCTEYRLPDDPGVWPRTPNGTAPIGLPVPHMEHLVLDEDGRPAEEGELCLRGPQRFSGYLNAADNSERFMEFTDGRGRAVEEGAPPHEDLWYRTGDDRPTDQMGQSGQKSGGRRAAGPVLERGTVGRFPGPPRRREGLRRPRPDNRGRWRTQPRRLARDMPRGARRIP